MTDQPIAGATDVQAFIRNPVSSPFGIPINNVIKEPLLSGTFTADPGFEITSVDVVAAGGYGRVGAMAAMVDVGVRLGVKLSFLPMPSGPPQVIGDFASFAPDTAGVIANGDGSLAPWTLGVSSPARLLVGKDSTDFQLTTGFWVTAAMDTEAIALVYESALGLHVNIAPLNTAPVPLPSSATLLLTALVAGVTALRPVRRAGGARAPT